jgi:hypothetical protein
MEPPARSLVLPLVHSRHLTDSFAHSINTNVVNAGLPSSAVVGPLPRCGVSRRRPVAGVAIMPARPSVDRFAAGDRHAAGQTHCWKEAPSSRCLRGGRRISRHRPVRSSQRSIDSSTSSSATATSSFSDDDVHLTALESSCDDASELRKTTLWDQIRLRSVCRRPALEQIATWQRSSVLGGTTRRTAVDVPKR